MEVLWDNETLRSELRHPCLLASCILRMNEILLCSSIDRLIDERQELLRFIVLSLLAQILHLADHGLHVRLIGLPPITTDGVLRSTFFGGFDDWHIACSIRIQKEDARKRFIESGSGLGLGSEILSIPDPDPDPTDHSFFIDSSVIFLLN